MKKLIFIICLLLTSFVLAGQVLTADSSSVKGYNISYVSQAGISTTSSLGSEIYQITLTNRSELLGIPSYIASNSQIGDIIIDGNGGIYEIRTLTFPVATVKLLNDVSNLPEPFFGFPTAPTPPVVIARPTEPGGFLPFYAFIGQGIDPRLTAVIEGYNKIQLSKTLDVIQSDQINSGILINDTIILSNNKADIIKIDAKPLIPGGGSYEFPLDTPDEEGLPVGEYLPTFTELGARGGTLGWINKDSIGGDIKGLFTPSFIPTSTNSKTLTNSRISQATATRTAITHNATATFSTTFDMVGTLAMILNNRFSSDGNGGLFLTSSSGGTLSTLFGNDSGAGGHKSANTSAYLRFSNTTSPLSVVSLKVRAAAAGPSVYTDVFNVSSTGFMGIGIGSTNPRYPLHVFGTGGMGIPVGTTAERGFSEPGYFRLNKDTQGYEGKNDTNFVKFVHTQDVGYTENDILVRKSGRWTPTQKTGNRVNSYTEIQARNYNKGDVLFLAGGKYIVEDTTYLLTSPGGARNYGTTDNATRIQTLNGKYAHLQPVAGTVPVSPFISSYSVLADRTSNANITLPEIELYNDTEALQRALDFVSRKKDATFLVLDQIYLTVRDTVVIEGGVIMKGLYQGTLDYQQSPFKCRIFAHINDANRDVFQFPRTSVGGYLYNTGIQNCIIDAVSPCNALVAMYLVRTSVFEQNSLRGNYFFTVDYSIRHANYGVVTRGIANTKFVNNEMQLFKKACIYFTFDWPYKNTTLSMQGNSFSASGNGIISDYTNIVSRDDVYQTIDTSAIVATNARIIMDNGYFEEVGIDNAGLAAIRAQTDEGYTSITIRGLTASSGIDVSDPTNTTDFINAKGYDRVNLESIFLAGYRRLITTDSVQALQLSEIVSLGIMKSPLTGNYEGIDPLTVVNVRNGLQEPGRVINRQKDTYIEKSQHKDLYSYGQTWLSDTLKIENITLLSGYENLARFSDSIFLTNTPWIYNGARVSVIQNDTLFEGQAIAEKINIIGASASLGLPITENFKKGDVYTISFYYANSNVARIGIATSNSAINPKYKSIVQDAGNWNRYAHTFTYTEDSTSSRLNIFFDAEIGERLHMTNFQLERSGSIYDDTAGEYIKTLSEPIVKTATINGDLNFTGNVNIKDTINVVIDAERGTVATGNTVGYWNTPDNLIGARIIAAQYAFKTAPTGGTTDVQLSDGVTGFFGATMADGDRVQTALNSGTPYTLTSETIIQPTVPSTAPVPGSGLIIVLTIVKN